MKINCALLAIGNELLEGRILDTNSQFFSSVLRNYSVNVTEVRQIADELNSVVLAIRECFRNNDLIVTTGGLGPTFDDITAEAVSAALGRQPVFHQAAYEHIHNSLKSKGVKIKESHRRQANLPADCFTFPNNNGTALGFGVLDKKGKLIISLPGIPYEMKPMFIDYVLPYLIDHFALDKTYSEDLRFFGLPESDIDEVLADIGIPENIQCIINVSKGEIFIRLKADDEVTVQSFSEAILSKLSPFYIGKARETPAQTLIDYFKKSSQTLSIAESCTGGLVGSALTDVPGSSEVFKGGIIVYSNWAKENLLDVSAELLKNDGPVSEQCARALVRNVQKKFNTTTALSITGIAGPGGGSEKLPVGTVYIGLAARDSVEVMHNIFPGDRDSIRTRAMKKGLVELLRLSKQKNDQ